MRVNNKLINNEEKKHVKNVKVEIQKRMEKLIIFRDTDVVIVE